MLYEPLFVNSGFFIKYHLHQICIQLYLQFIYSTSNHIDYNVKPLASIKRSNKKVFYKSHDSFYDSTTWRLLSREVKSENPFCYYCSIKDHPIVCIGFICDHVLPRVFFPELELEKTNLRNTCRSCDQRKRQIEKGCTSRDDCKVKLKEYLV